MPDAVLHFGKNAPYYRIAFRNGSEKEGECLYQALYRKWRPRTFDQVVGQSHITDTLKRQVAEGRLSHAYLFTGTRGTGKTTCAKILARAVNCEDLQGGNPCNRCPACLGIENGSILDVVELDAASNNGVDQIRALRDEAVYTPAAVRKRVYIVDEVHMLSTPAFNALLKILEEPPEHLMFILATTELHKVPATIKSRCQQFAFKRISPPAIADHLSEVAKEEGIGLEPAAAELLARLADGGLRDGLSLLDQCAGGEGPVDEGRVLEVLGLAGNRRTAALLDCVAREDVSAALMELDGLYRDGKDMGALLGELSALIRDLLIRKTAPEGGRGLLTGGYEEKTARKLAEAFTASELVQMMTILQNTQADLYRSASRRLDAELCLIRLCDRKLSETPEGLAARISRIEEQLARGLPLRTGSGAPEETAKEPEDLPPPEDEEDDVPWTFEDEPPAPQEDLPPWDPAPVPPPAEPEPAPAPAAPKEEKTAPVSDAGQWKRFISGSGIPPMIRSFLKKPGEVIGVFDESTLTLYAASEMTKGILSKPDTMARLQRAAAEFAGSPRRVIVRVGAPPAPAPRAEPAPGPGKEKDPMEELLALAGQYDTIKVKE